MISVPLPLNHPLRKVLPYHFVIESSRNWPSSGASAWILKYEDKESGLWTPIVPRKEGKFVGTGPGTAEITVVDPGEPGSDKTYTARSKRFQVTNTAQILVNENPFRKGLILVNEDGAETARLGFGETERSVAATTGLAFVPNQVIFLNEKDTMLHAELSVIRAGSTNFFISIAEW